MSRAAEKWGKEWVDQNLSESRRTALNQLNAIAKDRGQTLAQMALAWILRLPTITSALIGVSSVRQLEENVAALQNPDFTPEEIKQIDHHTAPNAL